MQTLKINNGYFFPMLIILFLLIFPMLGYTQSKNVKKILEVVRFDEEVWSKGDIDAYVALYAPGNSTRMILSKGAAYGKDNILTFYKNTGQKKKWANLFWMEKD